MANLVQIPNVKLNDGNEMPTIAYGLGTAWYKSSPSSPQDQATIDGVKTATKVGYTHLDGAEMYNNEEEMGIGINESGVPRENLYIVTKVKNEGTKDIEASLKGSLKRLGLDYVDLYLIHSPFWANSDEELQTAWAGMEAVRAAGLAKSIGVSNYLPKHLSAILKTAKVKPVCNQIEFHHYLQHTELVAFHRENDILTTAYSPLTAVNRVTDGPVDDLLKGLAKKYAVGPGEICLRWCIDQGVVPITTSGKEQRLSDYLRALAFKLTPVEIKELNELGQKKHVRTYWQKHFAPDDRS